MRKRSSTAARKRRRHAANLLPAFCAELDALALLEQTAGGGGVETVAEFIHSPDREVRRMAVRLLSGVPGPAAEEAYRIALDDRDPAVVLAAINNIAVTRRAGFRHVILLRALTSDGRQVVSACLEALASIGDSSCLEALTVRFGSGSEDSESAGPFLKVLGAFGDAVALEEICRLLRRRGVWLLGPSLEALSQIWERHQFPSLPPAAWDVLRSALNTVQPAALLQRLVAFLGHFADQPEIAFELVRLLWHPDGLVRLAAGQALRYSNDPAVRQALDAGKGANMTSKVRM